MDAKPPPRAEISILSLLNDTTVQALLAGSENVQIVVPDAYLSEPRLSTAGVEVLAIQRLITLAQRCGTLVVRWEDQVARRALAAPALYPLAAIALCLKGVEHRVSDAIRGSAQISPDSARRLLLEHRLTLDMFSDVQVLVCLDHEGPSLPPDLYDLDSGEVLGEDHFESFVVDFLSQQQAGVLDPVVMSSRTLPTAVMIRELFENTHDHARLDLDRSAVSPNGIRGLIVKRVQQERRLPSREAARLAESLPCLELSVFDSGVGYYESLRRQPLTSEVPLADEHAVLLKCLARHAAMSIPDPRPGHRGMGLYEVLRALQRVGGLFEVRTGRLHGYRSFLKGEWTMYLEPSSSPTRPGMPKAVLLDVTQKMLTRPTELERVVGSSVRVVIPLA